MNKEQDKAFIKGLKNHGNTTLTRLIVVELFHISRAEKWLKKLNHDLKLMQQEWLDRGCL